MAQPSTSVNNNQVHILQGIVSAINLLIVLPPILMEMGANKLAQGMYFMLGFICHQRADRSFYLFGNSVMYPKATVWSHVPFDRIFTLDFRQRVTCNPALGCRFGVCARCTGMYLGLLIGLFFSELLLRFKIPKFIPVLFIIPLILDGTVQTIAYILAPEHGFYESTNPKRFVTGLLFGLGIGYLAISAIKAPIAN